MESSQVLTLIAATGNSFYPFIPKASISSANEIKAQPATTTPTHKIGEEDFIISTYPQ